MIRRVTAFAGLLLALPSLASAGLIAGDLIAGQAYAVDASTGVATPLGSSFGFTGVTGLGYDSAAGVLYGLDRDTDQLLIVDPATGSATAVGPLGVDIVAADVAFDSANGLLYMVDYRLAQLFTIDPTTGAAALIGASVGAQGLAYDSVTNTLYASRDTFNDVTSGLYTIDVATGAATFVGGFGQGVNDNDLAFDPTANVLYLSGTFEANSLFTVNRATGAVATVGTLGDGVFGSGLAFVGGSAAVPEPSSLAMGTTAALMGLAVVRRRA
ncbi:YncE family protein [Paludisphaera mucosa]|uniref:PEP-CTERM protein-sorting domain-containing protein n=1 Tax=Paludisphaera mucosa TaxID=3030827 RepID=A0ABT6FLR4_9BACT|nr:hypothetical protein [Paludisphaera mucosa]MDG3008426.1 hypothetical protein [Paludisphaera mucosa]